MKKRSDNKFDLGPTGIDGKWGPYTENTIKKFQQETSNELAVNGQIDEKTYDELLSLGKEADKSIDTSELNWQKQAYSDDTISEEEAKEIESQYNESVPSDLSNFKSLTSNFLMGTLDAAIDCGKGIWTMTRHPIKTAEGIAFLYKATELGSPESKIMNQIIYQAVAKAWKDFSGGDSNKRSRMIGRLVGEIILAVVGPKGITAGIDAIKASAESGMFAEALSSIGRGTTAADKAVNTIKTVAEATAEVISKIRTAASDFLNTIKGNIIKFKDGYGYRPAYAGMPDLENDTFEFINKADISDTNKIDNISSSAGRLTDASSIASSTAKHLLDRHSFNRVQNQLKYQLKVKSRADIEADLAKRNFF